MSFAQAIAKSDASEMAAMTRMAGARDATDRSDGRCTCVFKGTSFT